MTPSILDRKDVLPRLFPTPDDYLIIAGLAGTARDAAALTEDGGNLFTMAGTMGAAVSMGLGVALSVPERQVAVIAGDGEILMNVGALATVATMAPENLTIVCIDNGAHGETGGQAGHTSHGTDLARMAEGAGIRSTLTIDDKGKLSEGAKFLINSMAPRFLLVRVSDAPPALYKRNLNPTACRLRFRNAFLGQG